MRTHLHHGGQVKTHLWSLWGLMELIAIGELVKGLSVVKGFGGAARSGHNGAGGFRCPNSNYEEAREALSRLERTLDALGCAVTLRFLRSAIEISLKFEEVEGEKSPDGEAVMRLGWLDCGRLASLLEKVSECAPVELETKTLIFLRGGEVDLYNPSEPLFGAQVNAAFPSAAGEIEEAGKCMALGRWTAAVMHLMRALEPAIQAFQSAMQVNAPQVNWQNIIDQIEAAIKANGPKHPDHQWNSEASTQFLRLKDAWRNYAMHGKERYDEERALDIYSSVKAFMRHLSAKLHE